MRKILTIVLVLLSVSISAQPSNDLCENADVVIITNSGFDIGNFIGKKVDLDLATREIGEICDESIKKLGNCDKTVWYKFTIPTTRDLEVTLKQTDSLIPQIFAGFTIYKAPDCNTNVGNIAAQLTPLAKFGTSGNACLQGGDYYIQVSAKNRVKGDIWVELDIAHPAVDSSNNHLTPFDIGLIDNNKTNKYFLTQCNTVTSDEAVGINNSKFIKSVWFKVTFKAGNKFNLLNFVSYNDVGYRTYSVLPTVDSLRSVKPFTFNTRYMTLDIVKTGCESFARDTTIYVQFILTQGTNNLRVYAENRRDIKDDWNNPKETSFEVTVYDGYDQTLTRNFDCDGLLSSHACKPVIPDYYLVKSYGANEDTLRYGAYIIIESVEDGSIYLKCDNASYDNYNFKYLVYEGNIKDSCNLTLIGETGLSNVANFCLKKGTYTVLIAGNDRYGIGFTARIRVLYRKYPKNIVHFKHTDPEVLSNYVQSDTRINQIRSAKINFTDKDTTIAIDTFIRIGRFIFREMYVTENNSEFSVYENIGNFGAQKVFVFSGRAQDNNLAFISGFNYSYNLFTPCVPNCAVFKAGYYTFISYLDTSLTKIAPCNLPFSQMLATKTSLCAAATRHDEPETALALNNNVDLISNYAYKKGINYVYPLPACKDCHSQTIKIPQLSCARTFTYLGIDSSKYTFFTFYIGQNCEVVLPWYSILYKGNASSNPAVCSDSNNIIDPCTGGNIYCNLEGGKYYTILLITLGNNYSITVTPHRPSPNDFAATAYDFGDLTNGVSKISPFYPSTCHTYAVKTDPYPPSNYVPHSSFPIPYKDTLNRARYYQRRNLWYTFTASNTSNITVEVNAQYNFCKQFVAVYKYHGDFDYSFANTLINNFDSTNNKLEYIASNNYQCSYNTLTFANKGCTNSRYFMLLEVPQEQLNDLYQIKLTQNFIPNVIADGDHCNNAVNTTISTLGTKSLIANNNCHTYGNSPFEDSVNTNLKSTWFRYDVVGLQKTDLEFKYASGVPLIKYNVYAGKCGALTKVASLHDQFSFFTLSCMGVGSYFIQAITDSKYNGKLEFTVQAKYPASPNCKPYDFKQPIAQFEISGGCTSDTLFLTNYSTQGDDISYQWYINDQLWDTKTHSLADRRNPIFTRNNVIKLVVKNIAEGLTDSVENPYIKDTIGYYIKIIGPPDPYCRDTIKLSYETNYPYRLNVFWEGLSYKVNPFDKEVRTVYYQGNNYILTATSDNCLFSDTIKYKTTNKSRVFNDTSLCEGQTKLVYDLTGYYSFFINDVYYAYGATLTIDTPGIYRVSYYYNGCNFLDTVTISFGKKVVKVIEFDTLSMCKSQPIELSYKEKLINYNWSTGSKADKIEVGKPGQYSLKGTMTGCRELDLYITVDSNQVVRKYITDTARLCNYLSITLRSPEKLKNYSWSTGSSADSITVNSKGLFTLIGDQLGCAELNYTVKVVNDSVPTKFLKDEIVCQNEEYTIVNPLPSFDLISTEPVNPTFTVSQAMPFRVTIGKNGCQATDSATIDVIISQNKYLDSAFCFNETTPFLTLDALDAITYNWLGLNHETRTYDVNKYQKYIVERVNLENCKDSVFFTIAQNCNLTVYFPNAFTPNNDALNSGFKPVINGEFESYDMLIANRWGEILYDQTNGEWDGIYMGQKVTQGVYLVYIRVVSKGKVNLHKGSITVLY